MKRNQCTTTNKEYELYVLRECGLSCEDVPPEGLGGYTVHGLELRRLGRSFVYISFPFILKRSGKLNLRENPKDFVYFSFETHLSSDTISQALLAR